MPRALGDVPSRRSSQRSSAAYGGAVNRLKAKFRELDANRDGMLNREELASLLRKGLPDITDREVRGLFLCVDTDGSGAVLFDEFVDFLFAPPAGGDLPEDTRPPCQLVDPGELELLRAVAEARAGGAEPPLERVEVRGASYHPELDGVYLRRPTRLNGCPIFARVEPPSALFFGWTLGRRRVGWFIAGRAPPPGPVMEYTACNRSPCAETPDMCSAVWETFGGNQDGSMFCLAGEPEEEEAEEKEEQEAGAGEGDILQHELVAPGPVGDSFPDFEDMLEQHLEDEVGEDLEDVGGGSCRSGELAWTPSAEGAAATPHALDTGSSPDGGFVDPEFPPEESSLGSSMGVHDLDPSLCVADMWTRLPQLHEAACLFQGGASPEDVRCDPSAANGWLLNACVAVAEFPAWVQAMFGQVAGIQPMGRYAVRLYHPGRRRFLRVAVDDLVPTKGGSPAFAGIAPGGAIWAALVEKAFAKLCGSYAGMAGGSTAFGMLYLCGGGAAESWSASAPGRWRRFRAEWRRREAAAQGQGVDRTLEAMIEDWAFSDEGQMWSLLRDFARKRFPVTCTVSETQAKDTGLPADRTYPLLSAREVHLSGGVLRMVALRDPLGVGGWRGRWGAESGAWAANAEVRQALGFRPTGDGAFWMSFDDFTRHFRTVDVVKKAMPLQGCHRTRLAEFAAEAEAGSPLGGAFELPGLAECL